MPAWRKRFTMPNIHASSATIGTSEYEHLILEKGDRRVTATVDDIIFPSARRAKSA